MIRSSFFNYSPIIILIFLTWSLIINPATATEDDATLLENLYPMKDGYLWRYERTTREGVKHYATNYLGRYRQEGDLYHLIGNPYGVSYYVQTPEALILAGIAPAEDLKKVSFYEGDGMIRLKKPMRKGTRWSGSTRLEKSEAGQVISTYYTTEIIGWSKVTVPAGTFDAIVTSTTQNTVFLQKESGFGKGVISGEKIWYTPEIGVVRRLINLIYQDTGVEPLRDDKLEEFIRKRK